jgi:transcriptional regulator with GAF, ATPase, and Fis domain
MEVQKKLLRVLQENEIVRIGSNKTIKLDVRVIAATNKNLAEEVKEKRFREDLFYRLQGFVIPLPPLKDRGDDIILLAKHFLKDFTAANKLGTVNFSKDAIKELMEYNWPGNIRQLKSMVERAALLCENQTILAQDCQFIY